MLRSSRRSAAVALLVAVLLLAALPGTAVAQSETGFSGSVVVEDGETVEEVAGVTGSVVVEEGGTVTGNVSGISGNLEIRGTVEGDLEGVAGNVEIHGAIEGGVEVAAGSLLVAEGATIDEDLEAGAGVATIDGRVDGDAAVGADTVRLGETAEIGGDLRYGGDLEGDTAVVAGEVSEEENAGGNVLPTVVPVPWGLLSIYAVALHLLLGVALLGLFPRFSEGVADRVATDPVRTGLVGVLAVAGVPILLIGLVATVVAIPISIVATVAYLFACWIGLVYGRFAVAAWALKYADVRDPWVALATGVIGGTVLAQVPYLGALANLLFVLLGLGALAAGLYTRRRRIGESPSDADAEGVTTG